LWKKRADAKDLHGKQNVCWIDQQAGGKFSLYQSKSAADYFKPRTGITLIAGRRFFNNEDTPISQRVAHRK